MFRRKITEIRLDLAVRVLRLISQAQAQLLPSRHSRVIITNTRTSAIGAPSRPGGGKAVSDSLVRANIRVKEGDAYVRAN